MINKNVFEILKQTVIPFRCGQSSVYGADCAGLLVLYCKMTGDILDLSSYKRGIIHPRTFLKSMEELGFVEDTNGEYAFFFQNNIGHCGLTDGNLVVHQDSIAGQTTVVEFHDQIKRYTRK